MCSLECRSSIAHMRPGCVRRSIFGLAANQRARPAANLINDWNHLWVGTKAGASGSACVDEVYFASAYGILAQIVHTWHLSSSTEAEPPHQPGPRSCSMSPHVPFWTLLKNLSVFS